MKITNIIDQAEEYLSTEHRKRKSKIKCLKYVLKKLRKREKKLEAKFSEGRGNQEKISNELAIIHAQRKKGIAQMQQLEDERKAKKLKEAVVDIVDSVDNKEETGTKNEGC